MALNLLPSQAKFRMFKMLWQKRLGLFSSVIITLFLSATFIIVVLLVFSIGKTKANQKSYDQLYLAYKGMSKELLTSQQLKYKAKMVAKVLNERPNYGTSITRVKKLFGDGFKTDDFEMKAADTFLIDLSTTDGKQVDKLEAMARDVANKKVDGVATFKILSITWSNSIWRVSVEVKTNEKT